MGVPRIDTVGIVGLGSMGAGIAQVCALAGLPTVGREVTDELCIRARERIADRLRRSVEKERLSHGDCEAALGRLTFTTGWDDLAACDLVIEAVSEDSAVKGAVFHTLDEVVRADAVLATNTSALSVTRLAASTEHPERVLGLHFFNPAPVLELVEVVRTPLVADEALAAACSFVRSVGKTPVACNDTPGFLVNRLLVPLLNDAVRVLDEGAGTPEDIDRAMCLGANWPIGPLALVDLIGLDVHVHASEALWEAYREPRFAPPPRLVGMLDAGHLGRKSGRGFYAYDA